MTRKNENTRRPAAAATPSLASGGEGRGEGHTLTRRHSPSLAALLLALSAWLIPGLPAQAQPAPETTTRSTEFDYDPHSGEVRSIQRVRAGYGKVAVLDELGQRLGIAPDRTIYVGDGSSDIHVMLHVNNGDGFTIAVSENRQLARIARSTVLSDNAGSVLVPILNQVLGLRASEIRAQLESTGLVMGEWEKARTDRVQILELPPAAALA